MVHGMRVVHRWPMPICHVMAAMADCVELAIWHHHVVRMVRGRRRRRAVHHHARMVGRKNVATMAHVNGSGSYESS